MRKPRLMNRPTAIGPFIVLSIVAVVAGSCRAVGIEVKLPYGIAYDLAPISIELDGGPDYVIYDTWKNPLAQGSVNGKETITFKPPKYGWYVIECGSKDAEHFTSGQAKFIGVTPKFANMHSVEAHELKGGWNDEALQAFSGLFMDRTNVRMNTHHGKKDADKIVADCQKYGITLLMQFEGMPSAADAKEWATLYKGRIKYWEIVNEPDQQHISPKAYVAMMQQVYPAIHEADPEAVVMGPALCGMGVNMHWFQEFYDAGGGALVDAVSFHDYEGHGMIDVFHWNYELEKMRQIMAAHGDGKKPMWQTERAIGGAGGLGYDGNSQALRMTMQRDILESWGIPNDHDNHYFAADTGYLSTFVLSRSGPHQAALACRTRASMIKDREFVEKIDFGSPGNNIFLGLRYRGQEGQTITLRSLGFLDLPVEVAVSGGSSLEVVDTWGNSEKMPVSGGRVVVTVSQWPCYLRLAAGQDAKIRPWDLGKNIAPEATFKYSGETKSDYKLLTDGKFQDRFPHAPFGKQWIGSYTGKILDEKPETMEISFDKPRPIQSVVIYGDQADNQFSAILDYDLEADKGGSWITLEKVHASCPPTDVVDSYVSPGIVWYETNSCYVNQLKTPVTTAKLRIVVRRITLGLVPDMTMVDLINRIKPPKEGKKPWHGATDYQLHLREIEVYGPTPGGRG